MYGEEFLQNSEVVTPRNRENSMTGMVSSLVNLDNSANDPLSKGKNL